MQVPEEFNYILDLLKGEEGGYIHRNSSEEDITNGYGIYRFQHPKAQVWAYIDNCAKSLGITSPSKTWTQIQIDSINHIINPEMDRYYSYVFYSSFFKNTGLEFSHKLVAPTVISLYTNGNKLYNLSLQRALNAMIKDGNIKCAKLVEDGVVGPKTLNVFKEISTKGGNVLNEKLKLLILLYAKTYYTNLVASKPNEYLRYAKGWDQRVNNRI